MQKIIIIGNSGSGKTWLAQRLAPALGIAHIQLDHIFWKPGGYHSERSELEIEADLTQIRGSDAWIVEGVFGHLVDGLEPLADTLIYLDMSWGECRKNLMGRGSESSRQLDPAAAEKNFQSLLAWAAEYENRQSKASKKYHGLLFDNFGGEKYRLHHREAIDGLIEAICASPDAARGADHLNSR